VLHVSLNAELSREECWPPVIAVSGEKERFEEKLGASAATDADVVQRYMTIERDNPASILCSVAAARDNVRSIRDVVSLEVWETINQLYVWLGSDEAAEEYTGNRFGFYRQIRREAQLCLGLLRSTMLHDTPLDFIWMGVMLERAGQTARTMDLHHHLLDGRKLHAVIEVGIWLNLLRACSGFEPFMKRHRGRVSVEAAAAFLLYEPKYPRSVRFAVRDAKTRLQAIRPPNEWNLPGGEALGMLTALDGRLEDGSPGSVFPLHPQLVRLVSEIAGICDAIGRELFGRP
jgi:uncharacterized alpha-E superfamily protein